VSTPELHADDLLDKEARGELSPDEQARLEDHLKACSVCRFERDVREDFRAEFEAEGQRDRAAQRSAETHGFGERIARAPRSRRPGTVLLLVAALLSAGVATAEWARINAGAGKAPAAPSAAGSGASSLAHRHPLPGATSVAPAPSTSVSAEQLEAGTEPGASDGNAKPSKAREPRAAVPSVAAAPTNPASFVPVLAEPPPVVSASAGTESTPTAGAMFGQANQLRERGAYDDAERAYTGLIDTYPGEPEALAAHAMLGRLLLDRGQPESALTHFDAYLRSGASTLAEEAQLGRALSLRKLGRAADEIQAWKTLLVAYPSSVHATRARQRLSELGAQ
jgi:TolA-binding protein